MITSVLVQAHDISKAVLESGNAVFIKSDVKPIDLYCDSQWNEMPKHLQLQFQFKVTENTEVC